MSGSALRDLEGVAHHSDAGVGVLAPCLRLVDQIRRIQALDGGRQRGPCVVEVVTGGRLPYQARVVGHELPQGDVDPGVVARRKVRHVGLDRGVQIDLAPFHQLHHGDIREELGNRSDPVHGLGRSGLAGHRILFSEPRGPHHLVTVHQSNGEGRNALLLHLLPNQTLEGLGD